MEKEMEISMEKLKKDYPIGMIVSTNWPNSPVGRITGYGGDCVFIDDFAVVIEDVTAATQEQNCKLIQLEKETASMLNNGAVLMNALIEPEFI